MEKKPYQEPRVFELGTVKELTHENPTQDKCGGSADLAYPQILRPLFEGDCPVAP
jgi:hypothetical protein